MGRIRCGWNRTRGHRTVNLDGEQVVQVSEKRGVTSECDRRVTTLTWYEYSGHNRLSNLSNEISSTPLPPEVSTR